MSSRIRVLVIDDSAYSRQVISSILRSSPLVTVVGVARNGEEGLARVFELEPDLVTVDLEMPRMDGYTFLRLVMRKQPTPVIAVSGRTGEEHVFRALELGAVDFVAKPSPTTGARGLESIERELIRKVHAIRKLRIDRVTQRIASQPALLGPASRDRWPRMIVIGSSTGGPAALMHIFGAFSEAPPSGFAIAQHMPQGFTAGFADRLDRLTALRAREARDGDVPTPGGILVAPGGSHLRFECGGEDGVVLRISRPAPSDRYSPSVDLLFSSAARAFGEDLLAIVLTGMGDDGAQGVREVKRRGGQVLVESEESAVVFGMPQQAIRSGAVDRVLPLGRIAESIRSGLGSERRAGRSRMQEFA